MKNLKAIELKGIDRSGGRFTDMGILQESMNVAKRKSALYEVIGKKEVKAEYVFDLESYDFLYRFPALNDLIGALDSEHKVYRITPTEETEILTYVGNIQLITHLGNILIVHTDLNGYNVKYDPDADTFTELSSLPVPQFFCRPDLNRRLENGETDQKAVFKDAMAELTYKLSGYRKDGYMEGHVLCVMAWRLYDNTYIKHSQVMHLRLGTNDLYIDGTSTALPVITGYQFKELTVDKIAGQYFFNTTDKALLNEWTGIAVSLCLFISQPISEFVFDEDKSNYEFTAGGSGATAPMIINKDIKNLDRSVTEFYKIHEIALADIIKGGETELFYPDAGPIDILATKPLLPIDESSHHLFTAHNSYLYNSRLHHCNLNTHLNLGLNMNAYALEDSGGSTGPTYDYAVNAWGFVGYTPLAPADVWTLTQVVFLRTTEGERVVVNSFKQIDGDVTVWEHDSLPDTILLNVVLSYPDLRAYKMKFYLYNQSTGKYYSVLCMDGDFYSLTPSSFHNYSSYMNWNVINNRPQPREIDLSNPGTEISDVQYLAATQGLSNRIVIDTNRIQVTGLNNPFTFPSANSYRVGAHGNIVLKTCAMGEAISAGQFGQFPLYVFSSQGVYALQVGSGEVLYASILPLNSDVVSNINSIINVGAGVVYATTRGLFLISGSQVVELSSAVEGKLDNPILTNNEYLGYLNTDCLVTLSGYLSSVPFIDYLADAIIGFDRKNRELIVSKKELSNLSDWQGSGSGSGERDWPGKGVGIPMLDDATRAGYSYVYSFLSKEWSKITQRWYCFLDSYPDILGVVGNCMYNLCEESTEPNQYMIQTRPITLAQHTFKKICSANLYGHFEPEKNTLHSFYVFGSQDGQKWYPLQGQQQPFLPHEFVTIQRADGWCKYFIFLAAGQLSLDSILEHIEVEFDERYKSKLR